VSITSSFNAPSIDPRSRRQAESKSDVYPRRGAIVESAGTCAALSTQVVGISFIIHPRAVLREKAELISFRIGHHEETAALVAG
jgi:hypothetical protein